MNTRLRTRYIAMVLVGVAFLLLKGWLRGYTGSLVQSYQGNIAASFATFFVFALAPIPWLNRLWTAALALAVVEAFELTNGFGVMTNVYDPFDYLANAAGVALACGVDALLARRAPGS